jgi:hypothetical protein
MHAEVVRISANLVRLRGVAGGVARFFLDFAAPRPEERSVELLDNAVTL